MPRIRRQNLPPRLMDHLADRVRLRQICAVRDVTQLILQLKAIVPESWWIKRNTALPSVVCAVESVPGKRRAMT